MMAEHEVLFRGKRTENDEWKYGVPHYNLDTEIEFITVPGKIYPNCFKVNPDTVGQFISVLDKNKRQIFDGDIVRTKYGRICKVVWFSPQLCWDLYPLECKSKAPDTYDLFKSENLEVIGNIYDNPEILKEGNELYV